MKTIQYHTSNQKINELLKKDPSLKQLFLLKEEIVFNLNDDYFDSLVQTIISQQLSTRVADVIYKRLINLFDGNITIHSINNKTDEEYKSIGLSHQKIKYLRSLSNALIDKKVDLNNLEHLTNQEIIDMLIQIKGIGIWSAQMFLMFSLGREDVFSILDLGLRNAVKKYYNNFNLSNEEIIKMSEKWSPYRSIVSHYLWHAWDNK
jgi:DNA-3-methyladenine glycosylase II